MAVSSVSIDTEYLTYELKYTYTATSTNGSRVILTLRKFDSTTVWGKSESDFTQYFDNCMLIDTSGNISIIYMISYNSSTKLFTLIDINQNTDTVAYNDLTQLTEQSRIVG